MRRRLHVGQFLLLTQLQPRNGAEPSHGHAWVIHARCRALLTRRVCSSRALDFMRIFDIGNTPLTVSWSCMQANPRRCGKRTSFKLGDLYNMTWSKSFWSSNSAFSNIGSMFRRHWLPNASASCPQLAPNPGAHLHTKMRNTRPAAYPTLRGNPTTIINSFSCLYDIFELKQSKVLLSKTW